MIMRNIYQDSNSETLLGMSAYHSDLCAIKDLNSCYIAANDAVAKFVGLKKGNDLLGKWDRELPCKAAKNAPSFIKNDKNALSYCKNMHFISFDQYQNEDWHLLYSTRSPVIEENGEIKGITLRSIDITSFSLLNAGILLSGILSEKIMQRKSFSFVMQPNYEQISLSRQESLCLFYFLHGYAIKKIAIILKLSPSTIETYLERVKNKLDCQNRSQLIEKIDSLNLANIILS